MNNVDMSPVHTSDTASFLNRLLDIDRSFELAEIMSGIAHELNQPLAAITTFSHAGARMLDRAEPLTAPSLDVFREISQEALQAGARLQKLRDIFEPKSLLASKCSMADLLAELLPVLDALALEVGGRLLIDIATELPDVFVERLSIQRVLLALVRNASEASAELAEERLIRIDVSPERYCVLVGVTDSGVGVPVGAQSQLFQPFFTTKRSGYGLGLSSSRAIVESHGGSMGFNNASPAGVRFWFKLPVAPGKDTEHA